MDGSSELLVQQLKEVAYSFERLRIAIADIDHAIAIAIQRLRSRPAKPTRQERRRNGLGTDVEPHNAAPLAIEPELRRREKLARGRRQPAETTCGFVLQILEIIVRAASGNPAIDFQANSVRLYVARGQHVGDRQVQIRHPQLGATVGVLLRRPLEKMAIEHRPEYLQMARLLFGEEVSGAPEIQITLADGKAGAGLAELLQHGQTLLGLFGVRLV